MNAEESLDLEANTEAIELIGKDRFYEGVLKMAKAPGVDEYLGTPVSGWVSGIWYRKSMFEEKGLEAPTTWENILKAAQTLNDPQNKMYGIMFPTEESEFTEQIHHSLLGSGNWQEGVEESGIARRINREKLKTPELERELEMAGSLRNLVYGGYMHMLKARGCQSAFSPYAKQRILDYGAEIFALERENEQTGQRILALINISDRAVRLGKNRKAAGRDILWGRGNLAIENMEPYQVVWLELGGE